MAGMLCNWLCCECLFPLLAGFFFPGGFHTRFSPLSCGTLPKLTFPDAGFLKEDGDVCSPPFPVGSPLLFYSVLCEQVF